MTPKQVALVQDSFAKVACCRSAAGVNGRPRMPPSAPPLLRGGISGLDPGSASRKKRYRRCARGIASVPTVPLMSFHCGRWTLTKSPSAA
jgi:hypothetical protein